MPTEDLIPLETLRPWVEAETGMDFSGNRMTRLRDAVVKVLSRWKTKTRLERLLEIPQDRSVFLERLTAELTVGESFFFRNKHHIQALRERVLPEILKDNSEKREVRIWSAGCAGGEEPYSLAILVDQVLKGQRDWRVSILGTDLNPEFLERAREARYRPWSFRQTDIHENRAYFSRSQELFQLAPRIREHVRFTYLNLVKDVYPSPLTGTCGLDLILFRNVAIYLKPEITKRIIERFYQALRPGGWLLLGETEVSLAETQDFEARRFEQATFHQKPAGSATPVEKVFDPRPVLADFVLPSPLTSRTTVVSQVVSQAPSLPDWVPLPKKEKPRSPILEPIRSSALHPIAQLLAEQKWETAERAIEKLTDQKQRAAFRLQLAQALLMRAFVDRARQMLDRCLAEDPLMIEAQLLKGSFAEEAGDLDQAEKNFRRALYIDRNCPMAHFHLGLVLQQKAEATQSQRSFKTVLKLIEKKNPHDLVEYGEGVCYGRLREMTEMMLGC